MDNHIIHSGVFTADSLSSAKSVDLSTQSHSILHPRIDVGRSIRTFLRQKNIYVRFNPHKQTYTISKRDLEGYVMRGLVREDVFKLAASLGYAGFDPSPTNVRQVVPKPAPVVTQFVPQVLDKTIAIHNSRFEEILKTTDGSELIPTDPPYGIGYKYDGFHKDRMSPDQWLDMMEPLKGRKCVLVLPWKQAYLLASRWGIPTDQGVWTYNSGYRGHQHRLILWYNCKPDMSRKAVGQPFKDPNGRWAMQALKKGRTWARGSYHWHVEQIMSKNKEKKAHPCQIPEEIMRRIIQSTANPGDTIFEPFLGSGTTGVIARRYGYPFVGTDVSPKYCVDAQDRIMNTIPQNAPSQVLQAA